MKKIFILTNIFFISQIFCFAQQTRVNFKVIDIADGSEVKLNLVFNFKQKEYVKKQFVVESKKDKIGFYINIPTNIKLAQKFGFECTNCEQLGFEQQNFGVSSLTRLKTSSLLEVKIKSNKNYISVLEKKINDAEKKFRAERGKVKKLEGENGKLQIENQKKASEIAAFKSEVAKLKIDISNGKISYTAFQNKFQKELVAKLDSVNLKINSITQTANTLIQEKINDNRTKYYSLMRMIDCQCLNYDKKLKKITFGFNLSNVDLDNSNLNNNDTTIIISKKELISTEITKIWKDESEKIIARNPFTELTLNGKSQKIMFTSMGFDYRKSSYNVVFKNSAQVEIGKLYLPSLKDCKGFGAIREVKWGNYSINIPFEHSIETKKKKIYVRLKDALNSGDGDLVSLYLLDSKMKNKKIIEANITLDNKWIEVNLDNPDSFLILEHTEEGTARGGCSAILEIYNEPVISFKLNPKKGSNLEAVGIRVDLKSWYLD